MTFSRPRAEMMPAVTVPPNPKGLPTAITQSPTRGVVVANSTALLDQRQHQHPERRQKNEDRKLEFVDFFSGQKIPAHDQGHERSGERQHLHKASEPVVNEGAIEDDSIRLAAEQDDHNRGAEKTGGDLRYQPVRFLATDSSNSPT